MEYQFEFIGPALRWIVLVFLLVFAIVAVAVAAGLAALPGRVASRRQHPYADAVKVCGWLGLLTGFGWIFAMVWAYVAPDASSKGVSAQLCSLEESVSILESKMGGHRQ